MKENNYYTPKIEQIVFGFEYELLTDDGEWVVSNVPQDIELLKRMIKDKRCRAKYISKWSFAKLQRQSAHIQKEYYVTNYSKVEDAREYLKTEEIDKYYTPEIEEFHVGFEYEIVANERDWVKKVFTKEDLKSFLYEKLENAIKQGFIRVKYLDKEDIESFGFKLDNIHNEIRFNYLNFPYRLDHIPQKNSIDIYKWGDDCDMIGYITIKNKSELKRLLKQLGII